MENKTKLYLLTGFLQSGKTTFLTNVLNDLKGSKVAVMMGQKSRFFQSGLYIHLNFLVSTYTISKQLFLSPAQK